MLDEAFNEATKFALNQVLPKNREETVGTFVHNAFRNYLERCADDTEEVKRAKESLFNWRLNQEKVENGCTSIYDMSLRAWGEYIYCPGKDAVELKRGYKPVLDLLIATIPAHLFRLNTHVETIEWKSGVSATLGSGQDIAEEKSHRIRVVSSTNEVFPADHVIVTSSLGYLKAHRNEMFLPPLPQPKVSAIDRLGYGTVNKIYLEFEQPFLHNLCEGIQLAWLSDDVFTPDCLTNKYQNEVSHMFCCCLIKTLNIIIINLIINRYEENKNSVYEKLIRKKGDNMQHR